MRWYALRYNPAARLGSRPAAVFPGEHSACLNPLKDWADVRWLPCALDGAGTVVQMGQRIGVVRPA